MFNEQLVSVALKY